jgi:sulfur-oxidizing protein SoxZ
MKMRATLAGGNTEVRVLMTHPMTTAQSGQPLHFIQNITVKLNGKAVIEAEVSQAVSRNPVFSFRLKGGAKGDKVEVAWLDNKASRTRSRPRSREPGLRGHPALLCILRAGGGAGRQEGNRALPADGE